jgi:glycosyl transferase family 25
MSSSTSVFLLINMDRSKKRLQRCDLLLKAQNIKYHRIAGIDGGQLSPKQLKDVLAPQFSAYYKVLSTGEIGCYLSHRKCWQYLVDRKLNYAVILEDDFTLEDELAKIHQYITAIKTQWDCVKLMEYQHKRKAVMTLTCLDKQLIRYDKIPSCTTGYVISQEGAKKMLAHSVKISRPVDIDFQYWWESDILMYGLKPYMVSVNLAQESTIDQARQCENIRKSVLKQYTQKIYFYRNNKKHLARLCKNLD